MKEKVGETHFEWKDNTHDMSPKNTGEKKKDQGNVIIAIVTTTTMTMTINMTETVGTETEIDHIAETNHGTTRKETNHRTTTKETNHGTTT